MKAELEIHWKEFELDRVVQHFLDGLTTKDGKIIKSDSFIDTTKGKLIVRSFVEKKESA